MIAEVIYIFGVLMAIQWSFTCEVPYVGPIAKYYQLHTAPLVTFVIIMLLTVNYVLSVLVES